MKINYNSILFKSIAILLISFALFAIFMVVSAKNTFQKGYIDTINEKISIIEKYISPSIALNLSYGFEKAVDEIIQNTLKNPEVLLIKVQSKQLSKVIVYTTDGKTIDDFIASEEFIQNTILLDPSTDEKIGELTLVYSNDTYEDYMQEFYGWLTLAIVILQLALIIIVLYFYSSLKKLGELVEFLNSFNPKKPTFIPIHTSSKDEIASIITSTNHMIKNIIKYIEYSKALNLTVSEQQKHLKEAQRMAHVGSWEYDLISKKLTLSDEMYRIINTKSTLELSWEEFLDLISKSDKQKVLNTFENAILNGSNFDLNYSLKLENSNTIHIHTIGKVRSKASGSSKITSVSRDITQEIKSKEIIERLAYYDPLTNLPNRSLFKDRTNQALEQATRNNEKVALIFLDLDHFKLINDTLGHSTGDDLLIYVSNRLKSQIRKSSTIARLGGDEFVILLPNIRDIESVEMIANKLLESLHGKHNINSHQLYITTSIGISIYPDNSKNMEELIANADTAMYDAKHDGRNNYKVYSPNMGSHISEQMSVEQDLREAINNKNELELYYQAKVDTNGYFISGAEALIRWNHPQKGLMFPDDFIEVAESTGMILEMGNWIISEAIHQVQEWNKLGLVGLKMAINLSPRQFQDNNLVPLISSLLQKYHVDPSQVEFEVTETMSMTNIEATLRILNQLKDIGVSVAIDDFGTGYSSLAYLKKFPVNTLKIDKSFVMDIIDDKEDEIIVRTIISMAHSLGFKTVAEGVETLEHANLLKEMECDQLQGYFYSRPIPHDKFTKFLKEYRPNL